MEPIEVESVGFKNHYNAQNHHTEEYDLVTATPPTLIYRRGALIDFFIRFKRLFNKQRDVVRINFELGKSPNPDLGTKHVLLIRKDKKYDKYPEDPLKWGMFVDPRDLGTDLIIRIRVPVTAPVGLWKCNIVTNIHGIGKDKRKFEAEEFYIIFNPWSPDDAVYLENDAERNEYILNETGKIWVGSVKNSIGKQWVFGQFNENALQAAVSLLDKSGLPHAQRGSPILVTRALSGVINEVNGVGLLEGRSDGNYSGGVSPHAWTGSSAILDQYLATKETPVKYGQCWVFSAVAVTIFRTLGIPSRSTTNYVAARTNGTLTVDKYFDAFGKLIENGPYGGLNDACWNFHVWNDVWMTRPDLPHGYGGWQIVDPAANVLHSTVRECGPASVVAIKKGEVGFLYDTTLIFSEINADVIHYNEDEDSVSGFNRTSVSNYQVGKKIVTKQLGPLDDSGENDLLNVTDFFKNKENSREKRLAIQNAVSAVPQILNLYNTPDTNNDDVYFDLVNIDSVPFGNDFDIVVKFDNTANTKRTVTVILSASSVYYTGGTHVNIKSDANTYTLNPHQRNTFYMGVSANDYVNKLVDHSFIKLYAQATVKETNQVWREEDDFSLSLPPMRVAVRALSRENYDVNFNFRNPLKVALTNCSYVVEGPWRQKAKSVRFRDVKPEEPITITETFKAAKKGTRSVVVSFISQQLPYISGSTTVHIN